MSCSWQRQDKAAWCLLIVQSQRLKLLIKFVQRYTVCQFWEIITESEETYMSLRSEGFKLHESLSRLGLTWPVWDEAECRDFEACKIPQLANMGIKMGCQPWDCAMSIPHTQNSVRGGLRCFELSKVQWTFIKLTLALSMNPNFKQSNLCQGNTWKIFSWITLKSAQRA